jgi:hypothetical protein
VFGGMLVCGRFNWDMAFFIGGVGRIEVKVGM